MKTAWWWKTGCFVLGLLLALYYLVPTFYEISTGGAPTWEEYLEANPSSAKYLPQDKIKLGLDLQGGIHLVLSVDVEKFVKSELDKNIAFLESYLEKNKKIELIKVARLGDSNQVAVSVRNASDVETVRKIIQEDYDRFVLNDNETMAKGENTLIYDPTIEWVEQIKAQAVTQAQETINNRVDQFKVSEPNIATMGANRILIQLPGMKDPERALAIIRKTALLEFKLVDDSLGPEQLDAMLREAVEANTLPRDYTHVQANEVLSDKLPDETQILFEVKTDPTTGEQTRIPYLLKAATLLTGDVLEDARVRQDQTNFNQPYVSLQMNERGAELFETITEENVGEKLAIVLDNRVSSAPVIQERISRESAMNGQVSITLNSMEAYDKQFQEAEDLVIVLRAGSLPAPVEIEENRSVGPTLGRDSINAGQWAMLISILLVIGFMILYYRLSGLVADFALVLNVVFMLATLALLQATLTLPGIAGIVLTIGMAVDANVLIFERIREELRNGKTVRAAIESGFSKAHLTIIDANLTTVIAGVVLLQYGTGPIQGFAVTLILGVVSSYITALWVSRLVFEWFYTRRKLEKLSI